MKTNILILGVLIIIIIFSGVWLSLEEKKVEVLTDKTEYQKEESLNVNIKNNLTENICFSSCYPYLLEKQNGEWKSYDYGECQKSDVNETCIESGQIRDFEITLSQTEEDYHRIAIPICIDCKLGEEFKESKRFYSNEFTIKEKEKFTIPKDKESCESLNGKWGRIGFELLEEVCNLSTLDAGKECTSSNQCEGSCIAELSEEDRNEAIDGVVYTKGKCTEWRLVDGCHPFIEDGKVKGILCVD